MRIIEFRCPHCGKVLRSPETKAGITANCPGCGEPVTVPDQGTATAVESPAVPSPAAPATHPCPMCGETIEVRAPQCPFCGESFGAEPGSGLSEDREWEYGGFWLRFVATFVDGIVIAIPNWLIMFGGMYVADILPGNGLDGAFVFIMILPYALSWAYHAGMESSSYQATLGKMAVGLRVVDEDGQRITFLRATGRYWAKMLGMMMCYVGVVMVAFTERKQGLHDLMAGTLVVRR